MTAGRWVYLCALVAGAAIVLFVVHPSSGATSPDAPAPAFRLASLDGQTTIALEDRPGRPVVVNFWASWCGPCRAEASALQRAWEHWSPRGVRFIGVDSRDAAGPARTFVRDHGVTYPIAVDPHGGTAAGYGVTAMPQTFIISAEGTVVMRTIGPITEAQIRDGLLRAAWAAGDGG